MTIFKGKVTGVQVKEDDKLSFTYDGSVENGAPTLLDDIVASSKLKNIGVTTAEVQGLDLLNPGKEAWVKVNLTLKQPKDSTTSIPDAKVRVSVECTDHVDLIPLATQLIDQIGASDCELKLEWKE